MYLIQIKVSKICTVVTIKSLMSKSKILKITIIVLKGCLKIIENLFRKTGLRSHFKV